MSSCFDVTTCPADQLFNRITCNFTLAYVEHICNPINTCKRLDGLYDCCSTNIANCTIELLVFQSLPTIKPTITPNIYSECDNTCNLAPSTNKCYWYESQNLNVSCINKDNNYCCSHSRDDCCQINMVHLYIIFGSLFFLLLLCIFYYNNKYNYTRVVPEEIKPNIPPESDNFL